MSDVVLVICITLLCLTFCGEPDIHDAIISHIHDDCTID